MPGLVGAVGGVPVERQTLFPRSQEFCVSALERPRIVVLCRLS